MLNYLLPILSLLLSLISPQPEQQISPPDPGPRAFYSAPGVVTIAWVQEEVAWVCIWANPDTHAVKLDCRTHEAGYHEFVLEPHEERDVAYVPHIGDVYLVGQVKTAPLRGYQEIFLPEIVSVYSSLHPTPHAHAPH